MNNNTENRECIVIMPIEDVCEGYELGHFKNVYNHVIKPSVKNAGFFPMRADEINFGKIDYVDIVTKIVQSPMAIFDLSTWNDRIITGLTIREAFNMPTIVISDVYTPKLFASKNIKYFQYKRELTSPITYYAPLIITQYIKLLTGATNYEFALN